MPYLHTNSGIENRTGIDTTRPRLYRGGMTWMSIDPGMGRTGWAVWRDVRLVGWGLLTGRDIRATSWKTVAAVMAERVAAKAREHSARRVLCEIPQEMGGAAGEGALRSGSVRKLAYYVGLVGGLMLARGAEWDTVEPSKWKGQLPKEITRRRVMRDYPSVPGDLFSDVYDAIGVGKWAIQKDHILSNP